MKFCKNLQSVVEISDPEWSPYWVNYKMLKKLIKELPSLVKLDSEEHHVNSVNQQSLSSATPTGREDIPHRKEQCAAMGRSPGEIAFFKLLHAELKKAVHFFERAQVEFSIREERVREGMVIMTKPNSIMLVDDRWSVLAKSMYRLYKDLLLLETYAIMTYCAFSKILKKHDKVTGYETRNAFMTNVVKRANFTNYPQVLEMIQRVEALYDEVLNRLLSEGKESLYEDERLFISMIHRLNEQAMNTAAEEGAPDANEKKEKNGSNINPIVPLKSFVKLGESDPLSPASSLKSLVEENDVKTPEPVQEASASEDEGKKRRSHDDESGSDGSNVEAKRPRCTP